MKASQVMGGAALVVALTAATAMADGINLNRPLVPGASSVATELTLQQILDNNIVGNTVNAVTGQSNVALWTLQDAGAAKSYLASVTETGHPRGIFGIYSKATGQEVSLIDISLGQNQRSFSIDTAGVLSISDTPVAAGFGQTFGFYWKDAVEPYFSYTEDSKNTGSFGPDGNIKALTYLIPDNTSFEGALGAFFSKSVGGNDWILAFEDHPLSVGGDGDFNDAVFFVKDLTPVPEPGTVVLLGAGLLGLGLYGRRRSRS